MKRKNSVLKVLALFLILFNFFTFSLYADDDDSDSDGSWSGSDWSDDSDDSDDFDWSDFWSDDWDDSDDSDDFDWSDWWGDDWDETYNDFWSGIDSDDDDYDYDFDDITYNVPNGDGGFDTLTYDDVFDENGTFIYDYTGPGDKAENEAVIAEIFGGGGNAKNGDSSDDAEGYLSMYLDAVHALDEAIKSGEDLQTIEALEFAVSVYKDALDDYCEQNSYSYTVNDSKQFGIITNENGKTLCHVGDPVILSSGDFIIDDVDFSVRGKNSVFCFERHYSSGDEAQHEIPHGIFGQGWTSNLESRIVRGRAELYSENLPSWEKYISRLGDYADTISGYVDIDPDCSSVYDDMIQFMEEESSKCEKIRELSDKNESVRLLNRYVSYGLPAEHETNIGFDTVIYVQDNGALTIFRKDENSSYQMISSNKSIRIELSELESGFCVTYPVSGEKRYYSEYGLPEKFTFKNGGKVEFFYDEDMKLSHIIVDEKRTLSFGWDGNNLSYITDANSGAKISYGYENGKLCSVSDIEGDLKKFSYNSDGLLEKQIKSDGSFVEFEYELIDGKMRTVATIDENGSHETLRYNLSERTTVYTDHDGFSTVYTYDNFGRTLTAEKTDPNGGNTVSIVEYEYDSLGFLVTSFENGEKTSFEYDQSGNMIQKTYPNGESEKWTYSGYLLTSYTDRNGLTYQYFYDSLSRLTDIYYKEEIVFHFDYDSNDLVSCRTDSNERQTFFYYDDFGNITERELKFSGLTKTEKWTYDSLGRVTSYTDALGRRSEFTYSAHAKTSVLYNGLKIEEEYSSRKLLLKRTETDTRTGEKRVHSYEYDKNKRCTAEYISGIDSQKNVINPLLIASMQYRPSGKLASYMEFDVLDDIDNSFATEFAYDSLGNFDYALSSLYENASSVQYAVTAYPIKSMPVSNLCDICAPAKISYSLQNSIIQLEFDILGRITSKKITESDGTVVREDSWIYGDGKLTHVSGGKYYEDFYYNAFSELVAYVDGEGNKTEFIRDILGHVCMEIDPYGSKTFMTYDGRNQLESVTFPDGNTVKYQYDGRSKCVCATDSLGILWKGSYNSDGFLSAFSERPRMSSYDYEYDKGGNLSSISIDGNLERQIEYSSDKKSCIVKDSFGNTNTYFYNDTGLLSSWQNTFGKNCELHYNPDNSVARQKDFNGITKNFIYGKNFKKVESSDGSSFVYKYDASGNLTEASGKDGDLFFTYDTAGLLLSQHDGNPANKISYSYNSAKKLIKVESKERSISYSRGKNGEILEITDTVHVENFPSKISVRFVYDKCGRETLRVYDTGESLNTIYDKYGRRILSVGYSSEMNPVFVDGLVYNQAGEIICSLDSSFQVRLYSYDSRGRLKSISYSYSDFVAHKMKSEIASAGLYYLESSASYERLSLDSAVYYELQELCSKIGLGTYQINPNETMIRENYEYDSNNNMIKKTNPFGAITYSYDSENRLVSWGNSGRASYDANGNMISKIDSFSEVSYEFNSENRIEKIRGHNFLDDSVYVRAFSYDALGRRSESWEDNNGRTRNAYIGFGEMLFSSRQEFSDVAENFATSESGKNRTKTENGGGSSGRYVFIGDEASGKGVSKTSFNAGNLHPLYDYNGNILSYFCFGENYDGEKHLLMTDRAGSVRTELSGQGEISQYSYDAFGIPLSGSGKFGFAGKRFDSKTCLYDFGFRDYCPEYARFSSVDPVHDGMNWYVYCNGNPVEFFDMTGLFPIKTEEQYMQDMGHVYLGNSTSEYADLEGCLVTAIAESLSAITGVPVSNDYINVLQTCFSGGNISWDGIESTFGLVKSTEFNAKANVTDNSVKKGGIVSMVNQTRNSYDMFDYFMKGDILKNNSAIKGLVAIEDIKDIKNTLSSINKSEIGKTVVAQVNFDGANLHFVGIGTEIKTIHGQQVVAVTATSKFDTAAQLGNNRKEQGWIVDKGQVYLPITLINRIDTLSKAQ